MKNFLRNWWKALAGLGAGIGLGIGGDCAVRGIKKKIQAKKAAKETEQVNPDDIVDYTVEEKSETN